MITEQRLDEMEVRLRLAAEVTLPSDYARELIRLARLGLKAESTGKEIADAAKVAGVEDVQTYTKQMMLLGIWAEKHGVPQLKEALECFCGSARCECCNAVADEVNEALAQLPKQGE